MAPEYFSYHDYLFIDVVVDMVHSFFSVCVCVCGLKILFLIYASCFSCLGGGVDDNQKLKGKPYIIYQGGEGKTNNNKIRGNK